MPLLTAAAALLGACQGPPDGDGGSADRRSQMPVHAGGRQPRGACDAAVRVGSFAVELGEDFTAVSGSIADAVLPADIPTLVEAKGSCRLLRRDNPFCDPHCTAVQACSRAGTCVAYPRGLDAGVVTVRGLRRTVQMRPLVPGNRYSDTTLPHPGFDPGARIILEAGGRDVPAFSLEAVGVGPIALAAGEPRLERGQASEVAWTTASSARPPGAAARVHITIDVDQHGNSPARLECEVEDTGRFTVEASLVTALLDAGVSGYPTALVARRSVDSMTMPQGCVELEVLSRVRRTLVIPGHTPCRRASDCPASQSCHVATNTCR